MTTYAEQVNYWQTSRTSADSWLDKTKKEITAAGGTVLAEGFGSDVGTGRSAYMLGFTLDDQRYKIVWPVLPSKTGNERAARIQAATMLYHDVKARCVAAKAIGSRSAFFGYLLLSDGRAAAEATLPEVVEMLPAVLSGRLLAVKE